jgi:hypothetical protein
VNIQPRKKFQQDSEAMRRHADIFGSTEMQLWLMVAWSEYCLMLPSSQGAMDSVDNNSKRCGAREFMETLMSLSSQTKPHVPLSDNLPHRP